MSEPVTDPVEMETTEIDLMVFCMGNNAEDIATVRALGLDVDDDNNPAPENIPDPSGQAPGLQRGKVNPGQTWGWSGVDNCHWCTK